MERFRNSSVMDQAEESVLAFFIWTEERDPLTHRVRSDEQVQTQDLLQLRPLHWSAGAFPSFQQRAEEGKVGILDRAVRM